jgi:chromosome segregation ATPase
MELTPEQKALREREEDYASSRVSGAVAGAVAGAVLGGLLAAATGNSRLAGQYAAAGAAAGGVAGYAGATYLTRDHSDFVASREALNADLEVAQEQTEASRRNVRAARAVLVQQRDRIQELNAAYRRQEATAEEYEAQLASYAEDREKVQELIDTTEDRVANLNASIASYRSAGINASGLESSAAAQERDLRNLRDIEDAMVDLIGGAPSGVKTPALS